MKSPVVLLGAAFLLGGCMTVPYESDNVYYPAYPVTVTAHASSGYYYPERGYPYAAPPHTRPYPYQPYRYYQPPAYQPPAPIIVPPTLEFRYHRSDRQGWQGQPAPRQDHFRDGPRPGWHRPGTPQPGWDHRGDGRRDWQGRDWQRRDWQNRRDGNHDWQGNRPNSWRHDGPRGTYPSR